MDTERYCATLERVEKATAIRAIHQAWLQLTALDRNIDCEHYDNAPAMEALASVLRAAGHPGFAA